MDIRVVKSGIRQDAGHKTVYTYITKEQSLTTQYKNLHLAQSPTPQNKIAYLVLQGF